MSLDRKRIEIGDALDEVLRNRKEEFPLFTANVETDEKNLFLEVCMYYGNSLVRHISTKITTKKHAVDTLKKELLEI